jgi:ADP-ribose pyrophosphatase
MEETILTSEKIYDGKIIDLTVHQVKLSNDKKTKREVIGHPGAVAIVAFDTNGDVLLVRQFRLAAGKILSEVPAGTMNPGEDPRECAIREMQEETGYKPGKLEPLGGIYVAPGYTTEFIHLFLATELTESKLASDEDEFVEVDHVPFKDVLAMIDRGELVDAKSNVSLMRVARRMGL